MSLRIKPLVTSVLGTVVESYDLLLYIHLLPILMPLFFPQEGQFSARLAGVMTISATLLMRPLGAIFFGYMGDTKGRKKGLSSAIMLMALPTLLIGLLPTFEQVGLWAPCFLISLRLIQGFSMGGETGGAHVCLVEFSKKSFLSATASLAYVSILLGGLFASLVAYAVNVDAFNWRWAFVLGAALSTFGFYMRSKMQESQEFIHCDREKQTVPSPLSSLMAENRNELWRAFVLSFGAVVPFHLNYVYMVDILKVTLSCSVQYIVLMNIATQVLSVVLMFAFGYMSDRYRKETFMSLSILGLLLVVYPLILYNHSFPSVGLSFAIQWALCLTLSLYAGGFFSTVALLFPVNRRFTASGLTVSLGVALFSFVSSFFLLTHELGCFVLLTLPFMLLFSSLNIVSIWGSHSFRFMRQFGREKAASIFTFS